MAEILTYSQVADLADRRARRLPHALPALRRGADAHRAEDHRRDQEGARGREGRSALIRAAENPCSSPIVPTPGEDDAGHGGEAAARSASARCSSASAPLRFAPDGMRRVRRRLRALPGGRPRPRLGARGQPARPGRPPRPPAPAHAQPGRRSSATSAAAGRSETIVAEPILRRLSGRGADGGRGGGALQRSDAVRTVEGISRSLGEPQASIVVLSGAERRGRDHLRLGHLLVPVPGQPRLGPAGPPGRARPRAGRARPEIHATGTRISSPGRGFCRISRIRA